MLGFYLLAREERLNQPVTKINIFLHLYFYSLYIYIKFVYQISFHTNEKILKSCAFTVKSCTFAHIGVVLSRYTYAHQSG